jgi:transposase
MAGKISTNRRKRRKSNSKSKQRNKLNLQKPSGVIGPRVKRVGGEKFAIVCVDPAKHRSEWMMADYFGNLLIERQTLEHQAAFFKLAVMQIREAQQEHDIQDMIVVVERTGNYHLAPKRAFAKAGFETRVVHPFATKQYRMPADPGIKTDGTDLNAQHRAAVAGFGLCELELESPYRELQLRSRHRRSLVETASSLACQIRNHLHLSMPGYSALFDHLLDHRSAMAIARCCESPEKAIELGHVGLGEYLRDQMIRYQPRTVDKVLAWASQAAGDVVQNGLLHHAIWTDLEELYQHIRRQIIAIERELAGYLVETPYVRLLAIPGINVVSAADLAGELGPIRQYANANAITGRAGLYPSRHQSDQTDQSGPLIRQANRRIRCALMRIADNLAFHCAYYRGHTDVDRTRGIDTRVSRVKIAKKFTRLAFACVAGDEPMNHPAFRQPDSIIEKLREFHHVHKTPIDQLLANLQTTVQQLPYNTRSREAQVVAEVLRKNATRRRGGIRIGALLPAVLARLGVNLIEVTELATRTTETVTTVVRDRS